MIYPKGKKHQNCFQILKINSIILFLCLPDEDFKDKLKWEATLSLFLNYIVKLKSPQTKTTPTWWIDAVFCIFNGKN